MDFRDFLQEKRTFVAPMVGKPEVHTRERVFKVRGSRIGWFRFEENGRYARIVEEVESPLFELNLPSFTGHVVGNVIVTRDGVAEIYFTDTSLDRFSTVEAVVWYDGTVLYKGMGMDDEGVFLVREAFEDKRSISSEKGLKPELRHAFVLETVQRVAEEERLRQLEIQEYRRTFEGSVQYALEQAGASLLSFREIEGDRLVVRYSMEGDDRLECIVDKNSFQVLDAGICLEGRDGERGDRRFTLQSLPSVVREARGSGQFYRTRH